MPDDTENKTQVLTIQGHQFNAPAPYSEGHTLNAAEAATLNQVLGENLRNNFAKQVKDAKEKAEKDNTPVDAEALQSAFASYAESYEFQGRRAMREPADPVTRELNRMVREMVRTAIRAKNIDEKSLAEGKFAALVSDLIAKRPDLREEAARRVSSTQNVADDALAGLLESTEPASA